MRKWWRDSLRIMWVESALKKIQLGLNTLRVYLFFDNLIGPRRSEPGAMHYARRRLAQVGVCAGGCAETCGAWVSCLDPPYGSGNGREPPHLP